MYIFTPWSILLSALTLSNLEVNLELWQIFGRSVTPIEPLANCSIHFYANTAAAELLRILIW